MENFKREILSGLLLGLVLGLIGFFRVMVWHYIAPGFYGEHWILIASTIGLTLVGVVIWGTITGSMLPMVLKDWARILQFHLHHL